MNPIICLRAIGRAKVIDSTVLDHHQNPLTILLSVLFPWAQSHHVLAHIPWSHRGTTNRYRPRAKVQDIS